MGKISKFNGSVIPPPRNWDQATSAVYWAVEKLSGAAAEERETPGRELKGQMEMLTQPIYSKTENRHFKEGWIRHFHAMFTIISANIEFDFVEAALDLGTLCHGMCEDAGLGTRAFGNFNSVAVYAPKTHLKSSRRNAAGNVDGMNGYTAGFVSVFLCHCCISHIFQGGSLPTLKRLDGCAPSKISIFAILLPQLPISSHEKFYRAAFQLFER